MTRTIFALIFALEIFALWDKGGGPLLSHLALTGVTLLVLLALLGFRLYSSRAEFVSKSAFPAFPESVFLPRFCLRLPAVLYALFLLFFIISLFTAFTPEYSLSEFLLFSNLGILFIIFSSIKIERKDLEWFAIGLVALAVIDTLIGFFIYTGMPFPRFAGTFLDFTQPHLSFSNAFANFLLLVLPLAIWQLFKQHSRRTTTIVAALAVAILLSGFLLSFSRAAWASLVIAGAIFVVWILLIRKRASAVMDEYVGSRTCLKRIGIVLLITIVLVNCLQYTRSLKFKTTPLLFKAAFQADEGGGSIADRLDFWKGAVQLIQERPLFGTGILSFKYLYPQYQTKFGMIQNHPHNIFLKIGVENGLFALIFFALFLAAVAAIGIRFLRKNLRASEASAPALFVFLGFVFLGALASLSHNFIDFNLIVSNFTLFIIFIALGMNFAYDCGESAQERISPAPNRGADMSVQSSGMSARGSAFAQRSQTLFGAMLAFSTLLFLLGLHEGFYNIDFKLGRQALAAGDFKQAEIHLERAQNLIFKRDLVNYLALTYSKSGQLEKEKTLLEQRATDSVDAAVFSRLGEIYQQKALWNSAKEAFKRALALDPMNRFRHYYNLFNIQRQQGRILDSAPEQKARVLLEQYSIDLGSNRYFTILTDNPVYASKLYEFFGMHAEKRELDEVWFNEVLKFAATYGSDALVSLNPL